MSSEVKEIDDEEEALPVKSPENTNADKVLVWGTYCNGVVVLSTNSVEVDDTPFENVSKQGVLELSLVKLIDDELVAFPDNDPVKNPLNDGAVNVPEFGLYVNGVVALSTNSVEVEDTVLLNGIKYVPDVLSLVNAIDDEEVELPLKLPENVVAVIVPVEGLQDKEAFFCG